MRIAEIYRSIQGEGLLTGAESVFVRVSGCNLRCRFCDTPYTSWAPEGEELSLDDILQRITDADCGHVVVTGGEPMLFSELIPLCDELARRELHVTVETAGTVDLPVRASLMSISPKRGNSTPPAETPANWQARHEQSRHAPDVIQALIARYDYQFKFVIDSPEDCDDVRRYLADFPQIRRDRVLLMPQGTEAAALAAVRRWLEPFCAAHQLTYCPRRHIELYGHRRGT